MSSSVRHTSSQEKSVAGFPDISNARFKGDLPIVRDANGLTAFSFEFVAKPEESVNAVRFLPGAIHSGLKEIPGFAGSLVMVSDQEARLITVIIFVNGTQGRGCCERSLRRVRVLLAPYLDRCLRVQNLLAHLPRPQDQETKIDAQIQADATPVGTCFINEETITEEMNICVA